MTACAPGTGENTGLGLGGGESIGAEVLPGEGVPLAGPLAPLLFHEHMIAQFPQFFDFSGTADGKALGEKWRAQPGAVQFGHKHAYLYFGGRNANVGGSVEKFVFHHLAIACHRP